MRTYALVEQLKTVFGEHSSISCIGPAGEMQLAAASIQTTDLDGRYVTSSLEYETIWSMGAMIGNSDLDAIARLDFLCDDIGLDTISTGVAVDSVRICDFAQTGLATPEGIATVYRMVAAIIREPIRRKSVA